LIATGSCLAVGAFAAVNLALTGDALYFMPQVWWTQVDVIPARRDLYPEAGWLVVPALAGFAALVLLTRAGLLRLRRRPLSDTEYVGLAAAVACLSVSAGYVYLNFFTMTNVMEHFFYVTYLLPFAFLVVGAATHVIAAPVSRGMRQHLLVAGLVVCLVAPFAIAPLRFMPGCPSGCLSSGTLQVLLIASVPLVALAVFAANARAGVAFLVVYALVNFGVADQRVFVESGPQREAMHRQAAMVFDTQALLADHNRDNGLRFWVDLRDPHGWVHAAVAGHNLWDKRLVSLGLPAVRPGMEPKAGEQVVVASTEGDAMVARANDALRPYAVQLDVVERQRVQRGDYGFDVFITSVRPDSHLPGEALSPGHSP
jgi:hypothetical protein